MSITLLKRDITSCIKPFFLIFFVMSLYTTVIIYMYNPELSNMLNDYQQLLPEFMSAVGMTGIASSLLEWIKIYLYGFITMLFPLIFIIILNDKLVMNYIDSGSMANLLSTPNCRRKIILTQLIASCVWISLLMVSITIVGIISSHIWFPGELDITVYIQLNIATLLLQLVITAISFLAASYFNEKNIIIQ